MRAVVFRAGASVSLERLADPRPGPGEVLIRVRASGICHTDIEILRGNYGAGAFPLVPGHEFAGEVAEVGPGVTGFAAGQRVVIDPNLGCGTCRFCRAGRINLCENLGAYGVSTHGGFADYCVVRADKLHPIGAMSFHLAALAEPLGCVLNGLSPLGSWAPEQALVFGAGPIGMLMALALQTRGAAVSIVDPDAARCDMASSFGLTALAPGASELRAAQHSFDLAVDATGVPTVAQGLIPFVANGGAALFFGVCPQAARIEIAPFELFRRQLSLFGTHSLNQGDIPAGLALLARLGPQVERLVTHHLSLDEIAAIFANKAPPGAMKLHLSA